jgi:hypothetical protein
LVRLEELLAEPVDESDALILGEALSDAEYE